MVTYFPCPYLSGKVEFSDEREGHIAENHPDLLPEYRDCLADTLADPEQIRISEHFKNARLFNKWFDNVRGGKFIVVVVVSEFSPVPRHWIITAYIARKLAGGKIEWTKS